MNIILTSAKDPERKIAAIKAVRAATGEGLREAKDHVDAVFSGNHRPIQTRPGADLYELGHAFIYTTASDLGGIPREDVLAFVFDVLSLSEPHVADKIRATASFQQIAGALV